MLLGEEKIKDLRHWRAFWIEALVVVTVIWNALEIGLAHVVAGLPSWYGPIDYALAIAIPFVLICAVIAGYGRRIRLYEERERGSGSE